MPIIRRIISFKKNYFALINSILLCFTLISCNKDQEAPSSFSEKNSNDEDIKISSPWFSDETQRRGITFVHQSGSENEDLLQLPEIVGGGVAVLDADNDGDQDIYFIQSGSFKENEDIPTNELFLNDGNGYFTKSPICGLEHNGYGMGVAVGDINNDGLADIYVTNVGENALFLNQGNGLFKDVSNQSGTTDDQWGASCTFVDYNSDGYMDLFVTNYLTWSYPDPKKCLDSSGNPDYCAPGAYSSPSDDVLYKNTGEGFFINSTQESGLSGFGGNGLGVIFSDLSGDNRPDLFVANDMTADRLWISSSNGSFQETALEKGVAMSSFGGVTAGMGTDLGDIDHDGDLDLLVVNLVGQSDSLFRNDGKWFTEISKKAGELRNSRKYTRFGTCLDDFNNDGNLDLFLANGKVSIASPTQSDEENLLYKGNGKGQFTELLPKGGVDKPIIKTSRGAAVADFDNDGKLDIIVINKDEAPSLLMNKHSNAGNYIRIKVLNKHGFPAIGAIVKGKTDHILRADIMATGSYLSSNEIIAHFGLGNNTKLTAIEILWPDGTTKNIDSLVGNKTHTINYPNSN